VGRISPATGAEFAILLAQNASGNRMKVVQRLPVPHHPVQVSIDHLIGMHEK
jgi:multidrug resistance efflux pump